MRNNAPSTLDSRCVQLFTTFRLLASRRPLNRTASLVLGAVLAAPLCLQSAPATADAGGPEVDVTVALAPSDSASLARLAADAPHTPEARRAALARVSPTATSRDRVAQWMADHGMRVTGSSEWTVTATADASQAGQAFPDGQVPAAIAGDARAVVGLQNRRLFTHHSDGPAVPHLVGPAYTTTEVRDAYGSLTAPTAGAGTTIASVQFSGWSQLAGTRYGGDLVEYAKATGLPVPDLTAVSVNGAPTTVPASSGDDFEVALDQEALAAAAPSARQRVYVTTNDAAGGVLVYKRIADDVAAGIPISVVTTSWGDCEQDLGTAQLLAMEDQIERLAALGVTVFAASGDSSSWDCPAGQWQDTISVDFPASSPYVVGVGGTALRRSGDGWSETAWGPNVLSSDPVDGSGGGISTVFRRPAWQASVPGLPDRRLVPDIAAAADPQTGFAVYWSGGGGDPWWSGGGTSLGAPLQAGMFAATLGSLGAVAGVGDIHPTLYAHPGALRDVVAGTNGAQPAGVGYDLVTGLGSPRWDTLAGYLTRPAIVAPAGARSGPVTVALAAPPTAGVSGYAVGEGVAGCTTLNKGPLPRALTVPVADTGSDHTATIGLATKTVSACGLDSASVVIDTVAPQASASLQRWGPGLLQLSWSGTDAAPSSGLGFTITIQRNGAAWMTTYASSARSLVMRAPSGSYRMSVVAADGAGNRSGTITTAEVALSSPRVVVRGTSDQAYTLRGNAWASLGGTLSAVPAVVGWHGSAYFFGVDADHHLIVRTDGDTWQPAATDSWCWDVNAAVVGDRLYLLCDSQSHQGYVAWTDMRAGSLPLVQDWHALGGVVSGAPAVAVVGNDVTFFAAGANDPHHLYWRTLDSDWHMWADECASPPAATGLGATAYVACQATDGSVLYRVHTAAGWSGPRSFGGKVTGAPGLALSTDGLAVYAEGVNGSVYVRTLTADWKPLGGLVVGGVGAGPV